MNNDEDIQSQSQLREALLQLHGPLLTGSVLAKALGHSSLASLRQARSRGQVPVHLFIIPHKKGLFAMTLDVANWLENLKV